nr:fibrous sheath CABYR-binding protein-like [Penaeus vannamei]
MTVQIRSTNSDSSNQEYQRCTKNDNSNHECQSEVRSVPKMLFGSANSTNWNYQHSSRNTDSPNSASRKYQRCPLENTNSARSVRRKSVPSVSRVTTGNTSNDAEARRCFAVCSVVYMQMLRLLSISENHTRNLWTLAGIGARMCPVQIVTDTKLENKSTLRASHPVPSSEQEIQEAISEQKTPAIQSRNPAIQSQKLQPIQSPETPAIQKPKTPAISSSRKLQAIIREARNSAIQRPETPASQIPELQGPPTMIQSAEKLQPIHVPETPAIQSQKLQPFRQKLSSHSSQKPPCHSEPETLAIQSQKLRLTNSRTASSIAEPDLRPLAEPHPNPAIQFPENTHAIQESQRQHAYSQPETAQPLEPQHLLPAIQPSRKPSPFEPELQPYHVPETPPFRSPTHSSKQIIQFTRNSSHSERSPAFRAQKLSPFSRPDTPAHSDVRPALQPFRARNSSHSEPRKSSSEA